MKEIQIKNVRSLYDTGVVPLSPITLLIGENSSGKSTFLRTFPLIRQSISKRTDGPLLWAGDADDYVDFGSFSETITKDSKEDITFTFKFYAPCFDDRTTILLDIPDDIFQELHNNDAVSYSITITQKDGHEFISKLLVSLNQTQFEFILDPVLAQGTVSINNMPVFIPSSGDDTLELRFNELLPLSSKSIFGFELPIITGMVIELNKYFVTPKNRSAKRNAPNADYVSPYLYTSRTLMLQFIGVLLNRGAQWNEIANRLLKHSKKALNVDQAGLSRQIKIINALAALNENEREDCLAKCKLLGLYSALNRIDDYLASYFRQVHYIAPLRATAERYYRLRNLAIDEVDYQGKNLAIFLHGLSQPRLTEFQNWTQEYFGFKVKVERNAGHLSVKVERKTDNGINLSDTGFGYSQILPIITQLWDLSTSPNSRKHTLAPLVIAIEQPELHLHPALQARLAEAFIASIQLARRHNFELQLLLETHSETIVNYFGRAIARGKLEKEDISIALFNKDLDTNYTTVKTTSYDSDGFLINWPIGFFAPER